MDLSMFLLLAVLVILVVCAFLYIPYLRDQATNLWNRLKAWWDGLFAKRETTGVIHSPRDTAAPEATMDLVQFAAYCQIKAYVTAIHKSGLLQIPLVQKLVATGKMNDLVAQSALTVVESGNTGAQWGAKVAGPVGGILGEIFGTLLSSIGNMNQEAEYNEQIRLVGKGIGDIYRYYGPPFTYWYIVSLQSETYFGHRALSHLFGWLKLAQMVSQAVDWNKIPLVTPATFREWQAQGVNRIVDGNWSDLRSLYPLAMDEGLFAQAENFGGSNPSAFQSLLLARCRNRQAYGRAFGEFTAEDFKFIMLQVGHQSVDKGILAFRTGIDPSERIDVDLFDLFDMIPKSGEGSVSAGGWEFRLTLLTQKWNNWLLTKREIP